MKYIIKISFLLLASASLYGQQAGKLSQLLESDNPELKAVEQDYRAALEKVPQLGQRPDPELGIGAFVLPVETRLGPQWLRIGITQMLARRGELQANKDQALLMANAERENISATQLQLEYQLAVYYYQLYQLNELQAIVSENKKWFELMEKFSLAKVEAGKSGAADVLRIQLKINELGNELLQLSNHQDALIAAVNQLLNRPLDTAIPLPDSMAFAQLNLAADSIISQNLRAHPAVKKLGWQQQAADHRLTLNAIQQKPAFGVGLDYILVGKRSDAEPAHNGRDIIMPRASIRIPLNKTKYAAKAQEEQIRIAALEYRKTAAVNSYRAEIEKALAEYRNAALQIQLYGQQKEIIEAALRISRESYSQGNSQLDEWLSLQRQLLDLEKMKLNAITKSHLAKASISRFIEVE